MEQEHSPVICRALFLKFGGDLYEMSKATYKVYVADT